MVSPELLRMYPFFGLLNQDQYREIAMISQEVFFAAGEEIFQEGQIIKALYLLVDGNIDLHLSLLHPLGTEILVGEINPGEPFGISSLIYPYLSTSGVRAYKNSRAIKIDATQLLHLFSQDHQLGYIFMTRIAQAAIERLCATRVQLATERVS